MTKINLNYMNIIKQIAVEHVIGQNEIGIEGTLKQAKFYEYFNDAVHKLLYELGVTPILLKKNNYFVFNTDVKLNYNEFAYQNENLLIKVFMESLEGNEMIMQGVISKNNFPLCQINAKYVIKNREDSKVNLTSFLKETVEKADS